MAVSNFTIENPLVTVAIPVRDDARFLPGLFDALRAQTWPVQSMQIIVADGESEDDSVAVAQAAADDFHDFTILSNPKRIAASGLNLALARAKGIYFMRLDARARPAPDYIEQCVISLQTGRWTGVGGAQVAVGDNPRNRPIAMVLNCSLGPGWPAYRRADASCETETLFLGAYPTNKLRQIGGWDEKFVANEDYDLNTRLRKNRGKLIISRTILVHYIARDSLAELARQYFTYGSWRVRTWRKHPRSIQPRHLAPAAWVAGLFLSLLLLPFTYWPLIFFVVPYVLGVTAAAIKLAFRYNWKSFFKMWCAFPTMHLSWGLGFWISFFRELLGRSD